MTQRPDPRRASSWCREGVKHDHGACGTKWNNHDPRDIEEAARYADDLGNRERRAITPENVTVRLVEREPGSWMFGVTYPGRDEFLMPGPATAETLAEVIADARARQIRDERAPHAPAAVVGDVLGVNDPIPDNVLEVETMEDHWRRAVGDDRYPSEDGQLDTRQEYDWITAGGGGWTTTDGLYDYTPIRVVKVA